MKQNQLKTDQLQTLIHQSLQEHLPQALSKALQEALGQEERPPRCRWCSQLLPSPAEATKILKAANYREVQPGIWQRPLPESNGTVPCQRPHPGQLLPLLEAVQVCMRCTEPTQYKTDVRLMSDKQAEEWLE